MENINTNQLIRLFPPTKTSINISNFLHSQGWLTNGYFAIRSGFEPKVSKQYRFTDAEINFEKTIRDAEINITQDVYATAEIKNHFELQGVMIVKLQAEGREVWVNPRFLSYVLMGVQYLRNIRIKIGTDYNNPVLITTDENEVLGLVMPVRKED